ncbi:MAG: PIN domain-containing protein [archaeon]
MKLVIDSNMIIAALIRDSVCRRLILHNRFSFFCPDFCLEEINKYKPLILKKSSLSKNNLNKILSILFENIQVVSKEKYELYLKKASEEIDDKKNTPFVALALSQSFDGIWFDDKDFDKVKSVKVYRTKELITFF